MEPVRVLEIAAESDDDEQVTARLGVGRRGRQDCGEQREREQGSDAARRHASPHRRRSDHSLPDQADEQQQDRRHVPEILLLHDGHAAAQVRDVLGQRRHGRRRVEAAAGVFGDPRKKGPPHRGVEVLAVIGRRPHEGAGALWRILAARRLDGDVIEAVLRSREGRAVFAVAIYGERQRHLRRAPVRPGHPRGHGGVVHADEPVVAQRRRDGHGVAAFDALVVDRRRSGARVRRRRASGAAAARTSRASGPRAGCPRASATSTSPGPETRWSCRRRSADTPAQSARRGCRRAR